jgi:hypothetical protein
VIAPAIVGGWNTGQVVVHIQGFMSRRRGAARAK